MASRTKGSPRRRYAREKKHVSAVTGKMASKLLETGMAHNARR